MLTKSKKIELWRVYSCLERRTKPMGCHVPFVSRQKWKRQKFEKIEILDRGTLEILKFQFSFEKTKCEITYSFSKILENTYEGVQFSKVASLQPAALLKINSCIDISKDFRGVFTKIYRIISIYLISVDSCSYSNNWVAQLIESI